MANSVINSFYMLFKSDSKQAQDDIVALDKKLETLRAKGKKRTDDERKETYEIIKQRKALTDSLDENRNSTEKLIESVTQATVAYISFNAVKSGIANAAAMNRELTLQTDLWQQNASEVAAYGAAVKSAGGSAGSLYGWYQGLRASNAANRTGTLPLGQLMDRIHNQVKGLSAANAQLVFGQYGINDVGQETLLRKNDADYNKEIAAQREITAQTEGGKKASQEFGHAVDNLSTAMTNMWTVIGSDVLPVVTDFVNELTQLAKWMSKNKEIAETLIAIFVGGVTGLSRALPKLLLGMAGVEGGAIAGALALGSLAAGIAAVIAVALTLPGAAKKGGFAVGHWINRQLGRGNADGVLPGHEGEGTAGGVAGFKKNSGSAMDYLMTTYGLDRDHAAAIVANMNAESGGDPTKVGDNGLARGAFQWHPDRQQAIKKQFGVDVGSMSQQQSLDSMLWELKQRGQYDSFMSASGAGNAGAFLSTNYEVAAGLHGPAAEAMARANSAISLASGSPFNSASGGGGGGSGGSGQTVNVGEVNIHTQAQNPEEIAKIFRRSFANVNREAYAQTNDATSM